VECSGRRLAFACARAAIVYDARARRLVQAWKERGQRRLAREAAALVVETLTRPDVACSPSFRPMPGALERGTGRPRHSPTSSAVSGSCRCRARRRARAVERQRGLGLKERRKNVAGAFVSARASPTHVC
jgi:predicted amidophosphoribosyltransferase